MYKQSLKKKDNIRYITKNKFDDETDLIINNEEMKDKILRENPGIVDITLLDEIFDFIKYEIFINFLYKSLKSNDRLYKPTEKDHKENKTEIMSKINKIFETSHVTKYIITILGIENDILLQQRYISLLINFYKSRIRDGKLILRYNKISPNVDCDKLSENFIKYIKLFPEYKNIVKYMHNDHDIYISLKVVRDKVLEELTDMELVNYYDFEDDELDNITLFIHDNYIFQKTKKKSHINKKYLENIFYNDKEVEKNVKLILDNKREFYDKYIKIIIDKMFKKNYYKVNNLF